MVERKGKIVNFHTKIHLDLTTALKKRLEGTGITQEAEDEERAINDAEPYIDDDDTIEHLSDFWLDDSEDEQS